MSAAALELQRRYKREWQRAHPEKTREYMARYWEKKAAEEAAGAGQSLKEYEVQINEALRALQSDLNRDADRPKSSEGKPISGTETRVTMNRSIEWSRAGLRMTQYKEVTGVETEEREAKKWI